MMLLESMLVDVLRIFAILAINGLDKKEMNMKVWRSNYGLCSLRSR